MKKIDSLLKKLPNIPFKASDTLSIGANIYYLQKLVDMGKLERVRRGIYQKVKDSWEQDDSFKIVSAQLGEPSCICLWSALSYYELTDEVPKDIWIYVPYSKYTSITGIKAVRLRNPNWKIGIIKHEGFNITSLERTITEAISDKRHVTKKDGLEALEKSLREKRVKMVDLIKVAKGLNLYHKVVDFLELYG